jgi:hypothetical protein
MSDVRVLLFALLALALPATASAGPVLGIYSEDERGTAPDQQAAIGLHAVRQPWHWKQIEPKPGVYSWAATDAAVARAGSAGLTLLPFVVDPPAWAADQYDQGIGPPHDLDAFGEMLKRLVWRYGPGSRYPIRTWQIWNEPNLTNYWRPAPDAAAYVALLRSSAKAIHSADPGATVVAAGLPDSASGVPQLAYLRQLYAAGFRGAANAVAIHAYAPDAVGVLAQVSRARAVMRAHGDADTPLWITEFGYATGGEDSLFTVTQDQQARLLPSVTSGLRSLARPLNLGGLFAFSWQDPAERYLDVDIWPYHAGLLLVDGAPKPALDAFARALTAKVPALPVRPATMRLHTRLNGRRLHVRCSARCRVGVTLIERVERPGRIPALHVTRRWVRRLQAHERTVVRARGAGDRIYVAAIARSGAAKRRQISLSSPRTILP